MSTDIAAPSHQAISARTRSRPERVTGKLAQAFDRMIELGEPWDEAARSVGLTARSMRKALAKPHVIRFLKERRQVFREAASARNILRLCELRDQDTNMMAATKAVQILEQLGDEDVYGGARGGIVTQPGLIIQIIAADAPATPREPAVIDVTPAPVVPADDEPEDAAPAARRQIFVRGRAEPIDESSTIFRHPLHR
jgi:hypothetical protein